MPHFKKNIKILGWNLVILLFGFVLLEVGARVRKNHQSLTLPVKRQTWQVLDSFGPENIAFKKRFENATGFSNSGGSRRLNSVFFGKSKVFEQTYIYDAFGRRIEPRRYSINDQKTFLGILGCSFAFGIGVADNETLPFFLSEKLPATAVYNWGFPGFGPNSLLGMLEASPINESISQDTGEVILSFADFHLLRILASSSFLAWSPGGVPFYRLQEGNELSLVGSFEKNFPIQFLMRKGLGRLASRSELFSTALLPIKLYENPDHWKITAALISEIRNRITSAFPKAHFSVLLYPGESGHASTKLVPLLKDRDIDVFHPSHLHNKSEMSLYRIAGDGHPTSLANEMLASAIADRMSRRVARQNQQLERPW